MHGPSTNSPAHTVVVENKPGAEAVIGVETAKNSPADGYTVLFGNSSTHVLNVHMLPNLPYDPVADFTPLRGVSNVALVVNAGRLHQIQDDSRPCGSGARQSGQVLLREWHHFNPSRDGDAGTARGNQASVSSLQSDGPSGYGARRRRDRSTRNRCFHGAAPLPGRAYAPSRVHRLEAARRASGRSDATRARNRALRVHCMVSHVRALEDASSSRRQIALDVSGGGAIRVRRRCTGSQLQQPLDMGTAELNAFLPPSSIDGEKSSAA